MCSRQCVCACSRQCDCVCAHSAHPGRQALLKGSSDGQAAVVEVADELGVDGAAQLGHLPVRGGDEDALHRLHAHVVEERVLRP